MNRREFEFALLSVIGWSAAEPFKRKGRGGSTEPRLNEHLRALGEFGQNPQGGSAASPTRKPTARAANT